jgi:hypothetical protein
MVDLSHACVLCKGATGLNTRSTIKIIDAEYQVAVCTNCEENASPKVMRAALTSLIERATGVCQEIGAYLGREITLDSLCSPSPRALAPVVADAQEQLHSHGVSAPVAGVKIVNKPIQRDQRRAGGAPPAAPRQKIAEPRDVTGKPLRLPQDVVVLENQEPVKSDIRTAVGERRYNDGYNQCHHCGGDGGTNANGKTVLCQVCNGSGLL